MFRAHERRTQKENHNRAWLAWHTANFSRAKIFPEFSSVIRRISRQVPPKQTPEQMLAIVQTLNALMGGKVIKN